MVQVDDLTISYGERTVVSGLAFTVERGQKLTIYGESGSGKSSVLQTIAGLQRPNTGRVNLGGTPLSAESISSVRSKIGYLPQLTEVPIRNFAVLGELLALSPEEMEKAGKICAAVGLSEGILTQPFKSLSGGERQRMLLASVLAQDKDVFLLDEPSSALDQASTELIYRYIMQLPQTVITVSHNSWWISQSSYKLELCTVS